MSVRWSLAAAAGLSVCLLLSAVPFEWPGALEAVFGTSVLQLDPERDGLRQEGPAAWSFDLGRYDWFADVADDTRSPGCPGVTLLEDGVPLTGGAQHAEILRRPGLYSHWGRRLLFSPSPGRSPWGGAVYALHYPRGLRGCRWVYRFQAPVLAAAGLGLLLLLWRRPEGDRLLWGVLVVGLGVSFIPRLAARWDEAQTTLDTRTYVQDHLRPPLYPWFIRTACCGSRPFDESPAGKAPLTEPLARRVVRLQRLAFWGGWLCFAACLIRVSGRAKGLGAVFCFALYRCGWLCTAWEGAVMSETLASGAMFVAAGVGLLALHTRSARLLPAAAGFVALAAMTRLAGAAPLPLLLLAGGAAVLARRAEWRRLVVPVAAAALIGGLAVAVCLTHCWVRNGYAALNPLGCYERFGLALEFATANDAAAIENPEARRVFELALARRAELRAEQGSPADPLVTFDVNLNCWGAGCSPALAEYDRLASEGRYPPLRQPDEPPPRSFFDECWGNVGLLTYTHRVFGEIADALLARHAGERWRLTGRSLTASLADGMPVRVGGWSFPWLLAAGLCCCLLGRNRLAALGVGLLVSFLFADAATCLWEPPITRYMEFIQWLALAGLYFSALGASARLASRVRARGAVRTAAAPAAPARRRLAA
jgi:hypothetical protein